jgi:YD repeat-containing protein
MKKCPSILLIFFYSICLKVNGQNSVTDITNKVLVTPPQAAAYTQYGKVPVGEFAGTPDIKVPLYDIKVDNFHLPVYLTYSGRGVQPNVHAGWVGTGWSLFAGSAITRKVNGSPDELICNYATTISGGPNYTLNEPIGWYYYHNNVNTSTWYSQSALDSYIPLFPLATGQSGQAPNGAVIVNDVGADEFDFNLNGVSGAFFMGEDGKWKIRSSNGENITVKETVGPYSFYSDPGSTTITNVANTFTSFALTTGDGTEYIFGNDAYSIEFNRTNIYFTPDVNTIAMSWHLTKIILPSGKTITFAYDRQGVQFVYSPSSHITANSATISVQSMPAFLLGNVNLNGFSGTYSPQPYDAGINISDPAYLQSISFPEGELKFNNVSTGEADALEGNFASSINFTNINSSTPPGVATAYNIFGSYGSQVIPSTWHYVSGTGRYAPNWYKLNDIELLDYNGNKLKDVVFTYTQDVNYRLFLSSVQTTGYYNGGTMSEAPYNFTYNTTYTLPAYCTLQVDHWGYYNGNGGTFPTINTNFTTNYLNFRAPNPTYVQAGMLTQITYPTGGLTQFTYEPNYYMKYVANQTGVPTVFTLSSAAIGGGLRIKQIVSQSDPSHPQITYNYSYVTALGSTTSSGVLGMPTPSYNTYFTNTSINVTSYPNYSSVTAVNFGQYNMLSNMIFPSQNDDGNIVTYSSVIEQQTTASGAANNGFTMSVFSNHDNGYLNNPPDAYYWIDVNTQAQLGEYSDRSIERGLLLSESYYDNASTPNLIKQITNTYNNNPNRFNSYSKSVITNVTMVGPSVQLQIPLYRISAVRNYTFYPYLQTSVETEYSSDHSGNTVTTTTNYSYDAVNGTRNLESKSVTNSVGQLLTSNMRYALDVGTPSASDPFSQGIANLQKMHAIGTPVETYAQRSNADGVTNLRTISGLLNYFHPTFPVPNQVQMSRITAPLMTFSPAVVTSTGSTIDPSYEPRMYIDNFDAVGDVLNLHRVNNMNQGFQWGYNNTHPEVKIENAANTYSPVYQNTITYNAFELVFAPNTYTQQLQTFTSTATGNVTITLGWGSNPGSNSSYNVSYALVGPTGYTGDVGTGGPASPLTLANVPAGSYTLYITPNINGSQANLDVTCTYPVTTQTLVSSSGITEFFFDGFEENTNSAVVVGAAHTGNKYWGGSSYTTNFTLPSGTTRSFVIQWWNLSNGAWKFNEQPFTSNVTLTGPVDDVRIFPTDAQIHTYTYQPLIGMTSETDQSGKSVTYQYDALGRLYEVRDLYGNIIKRYCYTYNGQTSSCPSSFTLSCNQNGSGTTCGVTLTSVLTGQVYTYSIPASSPNLNVQVPVGNYNLALTPGNQGTHTIVFGNYLLNGTASGGLSLTNIPITTQTSIVIEY